MNARTRALALALIGATAPAVLPAVRAESAALPDRSSPAPGEGRAGAAGRVLVRLSPGADFRAVLGDGVEHLFGDWYRLSLPSADRREGALAHLARKPGVDQLEGDRTYWLEPPPALSELAPGAPAATASSPNDPLFPQQWHHRRVGAEAAWELSRGTGVAVAVIDSGISTGGRDLRCAPLAGEYDAVVDLEGAGAAVDRHGHGTFIAGIVAQCTDNGEGAAGLAHGARLLAVRACTDDGACAASDVARAIDWAVERGAGVITLSLGFACPGQDWPECSTAIENDALARAAAADVVVVAIAGNAAQDRIGFPANHPDVLGVAGVDAQLLRAVYSSWGSALSLAAPSGDTTVDRDGDGHPDGILQETLGRICLPALPFAYCRWQGTSFAGPHVAAAAALLRSRRPEANRYQIRRALEESALDRGAPGFDPIYGHGVLQADRALVRLDEFLAADPASCFPSLERLCLQGGRFAVEVEWIDFQGGTGRGRALPRGADSGLFWFFAPANLELLVKVLDGCGLNDRFWFFAAATTDVGYRLRVTDTATGEVRLYLNALGTAAPAVTDTSAFPCGAPGG